MTTLHITQPGHRCISPLGGSIKARYIQAGEIVQIGEWELSYTPSQRAYNVHRATSPWSDKPNWQFNNLACAAAKLVELGRAEVI